MIGILQYFWLVFFAAMSINLVIAWRRVPAWSAMTGGSVDEGRTIVLSALAVIGLMSLFLQLIALLGRWQLPTCVFTEPMNSPAVIATWAVSVTLWLLVLGWIWLGNGADTLGRAAPLFARSISDARTYTPRTVKMFLTTMMLITAIGFTLMPAAPRVATPACNSSSATT